MAAAYRVVVADRKEMAVTTIVCVECRSEVSVSMESGKAPYACPCCGAEYSVQLREALISLGRFHRSAATAEEQAGKPLFRFSIKQAD